MSKETISEVLKIFSNGWNKQVILFGPPGTSKTYSASIIAAAMLLGDENIYKDGEVDEEALRKSIVTEIQKVESSFECDELYKAASRFLKTCSNFMLVQFHPSYSYEDFVRGIKVKPMKSSNVEIKGKDNEVAYTIMASDNNGAISYEVEPKIIEKFCDVNKGKKKILLIDEINRAPLASVLGELIYGLEYRGETIYTPYSIIEAGREKPLVIPDDLYIIGTMNTADRSIGSIDYAVRRRFAFVEVCSEETAIKNSWGNATIGDMALQLYNKLMNADNGIFASKYLEDSEMDVNDIKIGHTYFLGKKDITNEKNAKDYLLYRIKYQIRPIYWEYVKDGIINSGGRDQFDRIVRELMGENN